jgi:hypothetical protein
MSCYPEMEGMRSYSPLRIDCILRVSNTVHGKQEPKEKVGNSLRKFGIDEDNNKKTNPCILLFLSSFIFYNMCQNEQFCEQ